MQAFVTGATGFIGTNLTHELILRGHRVTCLVRSREKAAHLEHPSVELVQGDLLSSPDLAEPLTRCDVVFHLAGVTKALCRQDYYRGNAEATGRLLAAITKHSPRHQRLVYLSSQAAAGPSLSADFSETDPPRPVSAYGASKLAAEKAVFTLADQREVVCLRPSIVFGPWDREMLPLFRAAGWGIIPHAGFRDFPANFIFVDDLVEAILLAATTPAAAGGTFFVHDGRASSWRIMNRILAEGGKPKALVLPIILPLFLGTCMAGAMFARIRRRPVYMNADKWLEIKQQGWLCSSSRIERVLGFAPRHDLRSAVAVTAAWYKKHCWL